MINYCIDCGNSFEGIKSAKRCSFCKRIHERELKRVNNEKRKSKEMEVEKICVICGKKFHSGSKDTTMCSKECIAYYRLHKDEFDVEVVAKKKKVKPNSLEDINAKARELHLTYGQYMARCYGQKG